MRLLVHAGHMSQELTKRFKRNLKTEAAKNGFKELLKRFARAEGGKLFLKRELIP